jgi:hypothetical protein
LRYFDDIGSQRLLIVEDAVKIYLVHFITWSNWSETPAEREFLRRSKPISSQPCVISFNKKTELATGTVASNGKNDEDHDEDLDHDA